MRTKTLLLSVLVGLGTAVVAAITATVLQIFTIGNQVTVSGSGGLGAISVGLGESIVLAAIVGFVVGFLAFAFTQRGR